jgi:hypothetical protein
MEWAEEEREMARERAREEKERRRRGSRRGRRRRGSRRGRRRRGGLRKKVKRRVRVGKEDEERGHGVWVAMAFGASQPTLALGRQTSNCHVGQD